MQHIFQNRKCLSREEMKAYLNDTLDKSSKLAIENHLLDCQLCSEAIEGFKQHPELLNSLPTDFGLQNSSHKIPAVKIIEHPASNRFWLRIAAGLIVLVSITVLLWQYMNRPNNKNLYVVYFKALPPVSSTVRGPNSQAEKETISDAMIAYGQEKYETAISLFEKNLEQKPQDNESQLFIGICYLALNLTGKAIDSFQKVRINSEEYNKEATWYLALAYLNLGDTEKAKEILLEINNIESPYQEKAKELLTKINQ